MDYLENFDVESGNDPVTVIHDLFDYVNGQMGADVDAPLPQDVVDTIIDHLANEDYGLLVVMEQNERYE